VDRKQNQILPENALETIGKTWRKEETLAFFLATQELANYINFQLDFTQEKKTFFPVRPSWTCLLKKILIT